MNYQIFHVFKNWIPTKLELSQIIFAYESNHVNCDTEFSWKPIIQK